MVIGSTLFFKSFQREEGGRRASLPSILPLFPSFTPTRVAKEDFLPAADLVGIALNPEEREERMDD